MRTLAALLLLSTTAWAADIPVKAPRLSEGSILSGSTYQGSAWLLGFGTVGGSAKTGVITPAGTSGDVMATTAMVGGTVGYIWGRGNYWLEVDAMAGWQSLGGNASGVGLNGPFAAEQRFLFGGDISSVLSMLPGVGVQANPVLPPLAPGLSVSGTSHPYLGLVLWEKDISADFGVGRAKAWEIALGGTVGLKQRLSNGSVMDVAVEYVTPSSGKCIGPSPVQAFCAGLGQQINARLTFEW